MPKRRGNFGGFRSKRSKYTKRAPKTRFVNQLGGWSSYPVRRSRPVLRYFSTAFTTVQINQVTGQGRTFGLFNLNMSDVPQAIRNVYQRLKVKKIEIFCTTPTGRQIAICRIFQQDGSINPLNVPGAQIKMVAASTSTQENDLAEVIRAARFNPPINVEVNPGMASGSAPISKENWLNTDSPTGYWQAFGVATYPLEIPINISYYYTVTLLCDGMKA